MTGPRPSLPSRHPVVAGTFYPSHAERCRAAAAGYVNAAGATAHGPTPAPPNGIGALIPHAGWVCSGAIAGQGIAALAGRGPVDVVVVFGAVHTPLPANRGLLDTHGRWLVPGGGCEVAIDLRSELLAEGKLFAVDDRFHLREHAIEVELPLIQAAWPTAELLPIEVPPCGRAVEIGRETARRVAASGRSAVYLASSDLTHYGTNYGFAPVGLGEGAMEWSKSNDRRLLTLIEKLDAEQVVGEAESHFNACGAGAIAALMGACRELGARAGTVLRHATSYETLADVAPQPPENCVGYAAVVLG